MVTGSQQFVEEYNRVREVLEQHPQINVIDSSGQPGDRFEVEYLLQGYVKDEDGSVIVDNLHRIEIELPFGYPHFAPTVKPLTPIFHPDVDPDAIRIADFWQQTPSLAELILHLGYMLSGDEYVLDTPFNQEAADYYLQHHASLPLDKVRPFGSSVLDNADSPDSAEEELFQELTIEETSTAETAQSIDTSTMDLDPVHGLIADRKLFEAAAFLDDMARSGPLVADAKSLLERIENRQNKVEQLYSLAQELEDVGKPNEALEMVQSLYEIAVDAPGSEELRTRLEKAAGFMQPAPEKTKKTDKEAKKARKKEKKKSKPRKEKRSFSFPVSIPVKQVVIFSSIILLSAAGAKFYFNDRLITLDAEKCLSNAKSLINQGQYKQAKGVLEKTQASLSSLTVLRFRKSGYEQQITTLLTSPSLTEGAAGHALYKGKSYPADIAQALLQLDKMTETAHSFKLKGLNTEALQLYRKALELARKKKLEQRRISLESAVGNLELENILTMARKAEVSLDWQKAAQTYSHARQLSSTFSDPKTAALIDAKLTAATFRMELDESKQSFTREEWQTTISKLNHALELINSNPDAVSSQEKNDLHKLLINARLYSMLSEAKDFYTRGDWNSAIEIYNAAQTLLQAEADSFGADGEQSIIKIRKTVLMVRIARIQEKVFAAEQEGDSVKIVDRSKEILQLIDNGNVPLDSTLKDIRVKVRQQVRTHQQKLILDRKREWLLANYKDIFGKHYPEFSGSELTTPTATLLKTEGLNTIFTVSCIEKSRGSSSRLELTYLHDGSNNTWRAYND